MSEAGQLAVACTHTCVRALLWTNTGSRQQACSPVLRVQLTYAACPRSDTALPNPVQRRLRFVKLYYEFPPSCLYSDARGGVSA